MRFAATLFLGLFVGFVAGAGAMLVAFPFLFPPPEVNETVAGMAADIGSPVSTTHFREGVPGQDAVHWARGGVKFYHGQDGNILMELQAEFEASPGPNYWIYLNTRDAIDDEADFLADAGRTRITKLKSFRGSQVYALDAEQFAAAGAVTIWCESFDEYIASANIHP